MFANTSHPTAGELRVWAYESGVFAPVEDWDLIISWLPYERLFLAFAADDRCPNAGFFLSLLYLIVGDAVRSGFTYKSKDDVMGLLNLADREFPKGVIFLWVQRSRNLLEHPETLRYEDWCAGGLARRCDD